MNLTSALLTFHLFTGIPGQAVFLASPLGEWGEEPQKMSETSPGDYSLAIERPWLHELSYKFIVNGKWQADPANADRVPDGQGGMNSHLNIPFDEDPLLTRNANVPVWDESHLKLNDLEGAEREVLVLTPPVTIDRTRRRLVTIYFQDGGDYLDEAGARNLVANLSTMIPGFPLLTAVFIPPKDREREYECLDAYADFTAGPLVHAIESHVPSSGQARDRFLVGPSLGGLITLYTALRHPEVFARAISQSGSLWYQDGALAARLGEAAHDGLRLVLDVGGYEGEEMLRFNRRAAEVLRQSGADFRYGEFPSTHAWIAWRNRLRAELMFLAATR